MQLTEKEKLRFMQKAYLLAKDAKGSANPNPCVAAVIVSAGKKIIGKGITDSNTGQSAELNAVQSVKNKSELKNASMFITLEPHPGGKSAKQGSYFIVENKIKEVYIACKNKSPNINGKGIECLKKHGVKIETSILETECGYLYRNFFKYIKTGMPYVIVKYAMTLDGKIATVKGDSKNIVSPEAYEFSHILRGESDCLIVGSMTYIYDNPSLTVDFGPQKDKNILRMVLTHKAALLPRTGKIFIDGGKSLALAVDKYKQTEKPDTLYAPTLTEMLYLLGERGITSVLVEGGGTAISSFFTEDLVDELFVFIAPKLVGGKMAPTPFSGDGVHSISSAICLKNSDVSRIGEDILIHSVIKKY